MDALSSADFAEFFGKLYRDRDDNPIPPMHWQKELAEAACGGDWPDYICLPTGAGKTSTIEIALFALAVQADLPAEERTAAMRTFLVVDRRTVVSEAFRRAERLRDALSGADEGVLKKIADRLRSYSGNGTKSDPLLVAEMRGGIFRDRHWCSSLTQPMIVTSTVDQVGSRLLFRGYGSSPLARPIQAAAVAHDSLIILDEAHISPAFSQTLRQVRDYQRAPWTGHPLPRPLRVVEMTATPPQDSESRRLEIAPEELENPSTHIGRIVHTAKVADLFVAEKVKGAKAPVQLAKVLVEQALLRVSPDALDDPTDGGQSVGNDDAPKAVGILCNTVATAKATVETLKKQKSVTEAQVALIIGAMRPIDRDWQTDWLRERIATGADRSTLNKPLFVVATQCIEVGADYDFDVLVTEAAPLDALTQRFGRLNRVGRPIDAQACIIMRGDLLRSEDQLKTDDKAFKYADPIYGNAVSSTWNWLQSVAEEGSVDFGIATLKRLTSAIPRDQLSRLCSAQEGAPTLLPAHLDLLCQTSQPPWPEPDVSLWLHGPQRNDPEVQVCWRADVLPLARRPNDVAAPLEVSLAPLVDPQQLEEAIHAISLTPPTSAECLTVPLRRVRSWLQALAEKKRLAADLSGDVAAIAQDPDGTPHRIPAAFRPIAWRGSERSEGLTDIQQIRPGDTLVFTILAGGWDELGYLPDLAGFQLRDANGNHLETQLQSLPESSTTVRCDRDDFARAGTVDIANAAFTRARNRLIARLHPNLIESGSARGVLHEALIARNRGDLASDAELLERLLPVLEIVSPGLAECPASQIKLEYYANRTGLVAVGPLFVKPTSVALFGDDEADDYSRIVSGRPIELSDHLQAVRSETREVAKRLALTSLQQTLETAAAMHDWGKADPRFQAILLGGDAFAAIWEGALYAKSAKLPSSFHEREAARQLAKLPQGFRHELLSLAFAENHPETTSDAEDVDLLLHLVASHHGHARPWAPVVPDETPPETSLELIGLPALVITEADRQRLQYHRLDSTIPSRFWRITRKYGWWGAAFLESVLRLSDQRVSQLESLRQSSATQPSEQPLSGVV